MIKEALEYLVGKGREETPFFEVERPNGTVDLYYRSTGRRLPQPEYPTVEVSTLGGLVQYEKELEDDGAVALVRSSHSVHLVSHALKYRDRLTYVMASARVAPSPVGQWMGLEDFVIKAQCAFEPGAVSSAFHRMMSYLQAVQGSDTIAAADDGVSQTATLRRGVESLGKEKFANPVVLHPYCTFPEVAQPAATYILRMRNANGLQVALFEVEDRRRGMEAIAAVKAWLRDNLPDHVAVIG